MFVQVTSFVRSGTPGRVPWEGLGPAPKGPLGVKDNHMDGSTIGTAWSNDEDVFQSPAIFNCPYYVSTMFLTAKEASCDYEILDLDSESVCKYIAEADNDSPLVGLEPEVKAEASETMAETLQTTSSFIPALFPETTTESQPESPLPTCNPEAQGELGGGSKPERIPEVSLGLCLYPFASRPCAMHICCVVM